MITFIQILTLFVLTFIFNTVPFVEFRPITITRQKDFEPEIAPVNPKNRAERRILQQMLKRMQKEKKYLEYSEAKRVYGEYGKFSPILNTQENIDNIIAKWEKIINKGAK